MGYCDESIDWACKTSQTEEEKKLAAKWAAFSETFSKLENTIEDSKKELLREKFPRLAEIEVIFTKVFSPRRANYAIASRQQLEIFEKEVQKIITERDKEFLKLFDWQLYWAVIEAAHKKFNS